MKILKYISLMLVLLLGAGCTDYNVIDTGVTDETTHKDRTLWEYFQTDPYNWSMLMEMAERAGLKNVFEGTSEYGSDITVFGMTNHSIRRYLLENEFGGVSDIPEDDCQQLILKTILPKQRVLLEGFPKGRPSSDENNVIGSGGKTYSMAAGNQLWIYTFKDTYQGVAEAGPARVYIVSPDTRKSTYVASHNIQTKTGVVHSLQYNFTPNDL